VRGHDDRLGSGDGPRALRFLAIGRLGRSQCGATAPGRNRRGIAANWLRTDVGLARDCRTDPGHHRVQRIIEGGNRHLAIRQVSTCR